MQLEALDIIIKVKKTEALQLSSGHSRSHLQENSRSLRACSSCS